MKYILIARLLGSLVVSEHDTEEACLGRKAVLSKEKVTSAECYKEPSTFTSTLSGTGNLCVYTPNGYKCN